MKHKKYTLSKFIISLSILGIIFPYDNVLAIERYEVTLNKCVDGDTARFNVNGEEKKARFLAINTPESVHPTKEVEPFGKEASEYTCNKLTNAKKITIEYDDNSDKEDKYGRILVWVFVDDQLLQKDLVSKGYAEVKYLYGNYKYTDVLEDEQEKAKSKKLRIWSDDKKTTKEEKEAKSKSKKVKDDDVSWDDLMNSLKNDDFDEFFDKILRKLVKSLENML